MRDKRNTRIVIIGAGFAGRSIAGELSEKGILGNVVAFLDDDPEKIGRILDGIPVYGPIGNVMEVLTECPAEEALIAIPGISTDRLSCIYQILSAAGFNRIRILPGISQIIEGDAHLIQTREIDAQDLLGRDPVIIPLKKSLQYLRGKRVLITGAGGSIGSELARQLLSGGAERLYLFDHGENNVYEVERELKILQEEGVGEAATIVPVIGDLQDRDFMQFILSRLRADVVFHCAAYKHVPLTEANPVEAIKNNVFGTKNLVDAVAETGVSRFVFISTDKAVDPEYVYGCSKMIAEEIVLEHRPCDTKFMVVRFGNVLDSNGSVVPLFRKQITKGGPVTVTHPEATRFFMTIPEAASLVLQAGGVGEGGNLYILDMGDPINIEQLARQMISFYGFVPDDEVSIAYIGLRPGEKLHERLFAPDETPVKTPYPRINRLIRKTRFNGALDTFLDRMQSVCYFDPDFSDRYRNRRLLKETIREYIPSLVIHDDDPEY